MVAIEFENDSAMCGRFSADVYRRSFKNASIVSLLTQGTLSRQRLSGLCPAFQALISFCLLIRKRRLVSLAATLNSVFVRIAKFHFLFSFSFLLLGCLDTLLSAPRYSVPIASHSRASQIW